MDKNKNASQTADINRGDDIAAAPCAAQPEPQTDVPAAESAQPTEAKKSKKASGVIGIIILCIVSALASFYVGYIIWLLLTLFNYFWLGIMGALLLPLLLFPLIFSKNKKKALGLWGIYAAVFAVALGINIAVDVHDANITVDTSPNINVWEYLPFDEESKIATLESEASLKLTDDLPTVDGAAAVFPVYSAFVNAVYPETTELYDGTFEYNNTVGGYLLLAEGETDIFFGAYPSEEQIAYAEEMGNPFEFTPIGTEAFVFFVHKDNPIDNLTTEQLQQIYSGEITNWEEVGGPNKKIAAYQRNEGSGSQSMLIRFMDGKEIMEPPTEMVNDLMSGIIEQVSDYRSEANSIGFSFRYYVEGIIQNPDIKLISIDGVAPTVENIKNGSYPVTTSLYAVTSANNENENVDKLIEWVLSDEGQELIEATGYTGVEN